MTTVTKKTSATEFSVRNYFEIDFPDTATVRYELDALANHNEAGSVRTKIYAQAHIDFTAHVKFCSFYLPSSAVPLEALCRAALGYSRDVIAMRGGAHFNLPRARAFSAGSGIKLHLMENGFLNICLEPVEGGQFDVKDFSIAPPTFIYTERELSLEDAARIVELGHRYNTTIRLRGPAYVMKRIAQQAPVAFISYDSRDKEAAREIAVGLSTLGHTVWFDEFALKAGERLRESIEKGLKQCKRCVLLLSGSFLSNTDGLRQNLTEYSRER